MTALNLGNFPVGTTSLVCEFNLVNGAGQPTDYSNGTLHIYQAGDSTTPYDVTSSCTRVGTVVGRYCFVATVVTPLSARSYVVSFSDGAMPDGTSLVGMNVAYFTVGEQVELSAAAIAAVAAAVAAAMPLVNANVTEWLGETPAPLSNGTLQSSSPYGPQASVTLRLTSGADDNGIHGVYAPAGLYNGYGVWLGPGGYIYCDGVKWCLGTAPGTEVEDTTRSTDGLVGETFTDNAEGAIWTATPAFGSVVVGEGVQLADTQPAYAPATAADVAAAVAGVSGPTAAAVWAYATRNLSSSGGAVGPAIGYSNADLQARVKPNESVPVFAVFAVNGAYATTTTVASITYTIYALDDPADARGTPVIGHTGVSLTLAGVLSNTLQTDMDAAGYNFKHQPDLSLGQAFANPGWYLVEYMVVPTTGSPVWFNARVKCAWLD